MLREKGKMQTLSLYVTQQASASEKWNLVAKKQEYHLVNVWVLPISKIIFKEQAGKEKPKRAEEILGLAVSNDA